ncbi:hypothetical protein F4859DRAFT_68665 [Xylaria cf. heliscus]|nr:hypothetical protein F4859DRAFT_68665 [Xylaria cf. heliscus]
MATVEPVTESGQLPLETVTIQRSPSQIRSPRSHTPRSFDNEPEASPRDIDSLSINSTESIPDITGRKMLTFDDERTTTVYEAWEFVCIDDRHTRQSWKSFCGINFGTRWRNNNDGCVVINAVVSLDQGELADMHEDAIHGYKNKNGVSQERAYEQDLANRVDDLPFTAYDKIQHLIEDKTMVTNRNPYRQREWRVVVLQPGEFRMTELLPDPKRISFFSLKKRLPATQTYFVVLRGREVKSTKEEGGWKAYNRISNPWWRLDNRETTEERHQHRDAVKRMDRARDRRNRHSRPRAQSIGPIVVRSRSPMGRGYSPSPEPGSKFDRI